jgi:hypothetical protein
LFLITLQIYNLIFDCANFFKDIFNLFSKVLIIKEKKTAANTGLAKVGRNILLKLSILQAHLRQARYR